MSEILQEAVARIDNESTEDTWQKNWSQGGNWEQEWEQTR